jgi:hypothetical protein
MATTYGNLVDEVLLNLSGYTLRQERTTHLTQDITASGLTLNLGTTTNIGKGVVEIGDELIWLDSYDRVSSTATAAPYGRGFQATSAAAHTAGTKVTVAPTFPRSAVKRAINEAIQSVYPTLYALNKYSFTYNSVQNTYQLPSDVQTILYVSWSTIGPTKEWRPVKGWRLDSMANETAFANGVTLTIYDNLPAGRTIQITYTKVPQTFDGSADSSVFEDTTGLLASAKDVIIYGAAYRLASFIDTGRLNYLSAEADNADTKIQFGSGSSNSRFLLALYNQRLSEEKNKLRDLFPSRIHYTRY